MYQIASSCEENQDLIAKFNFCYGECRLYAVAYETVDNLLRRFPEVRKDSTQSDDSGRGFVDPFADPFVPTQSDDSGSDFEDLFTPPPPPTLDQLLEKVESLKAAGVQHEALTRLRARLEEE